MRSQLSFCLTARWALPCPGASHLRVAQRHLTVLRRSGVEHSRHSALQALWARRFAAQRSEKREGGVGRLEERLRHRERQDASLFSRYATSFGKSVAALRFALNRFQPFSADQRFAIASWFAIGTTWWVLAGTSTFLSLWLWVIPSERFQQYVARKVSEYVSEQSGIQVEFGSAIQPTWKTLKFEQVHLVRTKEDAGIPNASEFDITIEELHVKVSLLWMLEGKGLVQSAVVRGVRGVWDRRSTWDVYDEEGNLIPAVDVPAEYWSQPLPKREWYRGSFELNHFEVSDMLVRIRQPMPSRPLPLSIFSWKSDRLRRQWLLYDILSSSIEGAFDNRLFSLRQPMEEEDDGSGEYRPVRFKMDNTNIDLVNSGTTGPLSWITQGRIDFDALLFFPRVAPDSFSYAEDDVLDIKLQLNLNHLNANVPLSNPDISYLNSTLVQPIVVYMNTNYTSIPLQAALKIPIREFDGAWTPYEARMIDALSEAVGVQMSNLVLEQGSPLNIGLLLWKGWNGVMRGIAHGAYTAWNQIVIV